MAIEPRRTPWAAVVEALAAEGVDLAFGLPGNPLHLVADLAAHPGIRPILVRHEASGAFMAYAYARVTGKAGVCFASPGPGSANLASGLLEAFSGCQPVIALANGTPTRTEGMGAFQELDSVALFRPITKWAVRPTDPEKVPWVMARAFALARGGRPGPVFIDLPGDMALREASIEPYRSPGPPVRVRPDAGAVSAALTFKEAPPAWIRVGWSGAASSPARGARRSWSRTWPPARRPSSATVPSIADLRS